MKKYAGEVIICIGGNDLRSRLSGFLIISHFLKTCVCWWTLVMSCTLLLIMFASARISFFSLPSFKGLEMRNAAKYCESQGKKQTSERINNTDKCLCSSSSLTFCDQLKWTCLVGVPTSEKHWAVIHSSKASCIFHYKILVTDNPMTCRDLGLRISSVRIITLCVSVFS